MSSQLRSLVWKEWQERRLQFVICMLWMFCGTLHCIAYEWSREFRAPVGNFYLVALLLGMFMPIFVSMRTSLGEMTDRTRSFSDSLPVSSRRRGWIRLAGGAGVLIVPVLVGAAILSACLAAGWIQQAPPHPPAGGDGHVYVPLPDRASLSPLAAVGLVWSVTAVALWSATTLYVLLSLMGTALRKETHAGFVGTVVTFLWILGLPLGDMLNRFGLPAARPLAGVMVPLSMIASFGLNDDRGTYSDLLLSCAVLGPLIANSILQLGLAAWFVRRYGRRLPGQAAARQKEPRTAWCYWPLPLSTRSMALTWLTLRQSLPMCVSGLLLACLMTYFMVTFNRPLEHGEFLRRFTDSMPLGMQAVGYLWAVVVGAGVFSAEIDSRLGEFWRTWPAPFWRLFAIKFAVGLLVVLLVLDGATIAASWNSPNWGDYHSMNWPYIACIVPLHATMFAVAVAWTCLLRRPVLGGMASVVSFTLMDLGLGWWETTRHLNPIEVYNHLARKTSASLGSLDFTAHGYPVVAAGMAVILLASVAIAGFALRRYDPRCQTG